MKRQNIRSLLLVAAMMIYLLMGAAIFEVLESTNEELELGKLEREKLELVRKFNLTQADWQLLSDHIVRFVPHEAGLQWKFAGAIYFSTTVITTIGYGHSTPKTNWGKIFCMIYALLGIPLNLVTFQSIGERLNTITTYILCTVKRKFKPSADRKSVPQVPSLSGEMLLQSTINKESYLKFPSNNRASISAGNNNEIHRNGPTNFSSPTSKLLPQSNHRPHGEPIQRILTTRDRNADKQSADLSIRLKKAKLSTTTQERRDSECSVSDLLSSSISSTREEVSDTHLILVTTSISTVFVAGGAYAFSRYEGWTYLDSLYFCIITLTTVGFGDLVALQKDKVLQDKPEYVAFNIFFILSGLGVVSAAMNLLVLRFLTMNTEDEKRDKMLESLSADPKNLTNILPYWLTSSPEMDKRNKFLPLTSLVHKFRRNFVQSRSTSVLFKPLRYRVTRAPTNVHHLIDVNPPTVDPRLAQQFSVWKSARQINANTCTCRSRLLTV